MSEDLQNKVYDYLEGRMSPQEQELFEKQLLENQELKKEVNDIRALEQGLHGLGVESFKQDLASWEDALNSQPKDTSNWKNFLAVAAVILLIALPAIYFLVPGNPSNQDLFLSYYQPYEEMITTRGNTSDSLNLLLIEGMEAYSRKSYEECSSLLQSYLDQQPDARVSLYLAIAQLELNQAQAAEANFIQARQDPIFRQQAQWYQALSYLKFSETEKAKDLLGEIVGQQGHYRNQEANKLLKQLI